MISVFTTATDPIKNQYPFFQALESYKFADEIVLVNGEASSIYLDGGIKIVNYGWPDNFSWDFIGKQFQRGYEACKGDWVIHADLDYIFHENDYGNIRRVFEQYPDAPAISFLKWQFIQADRYTLKSRAVIAVNKGKYGNRIRFDGGGDLCQPTLDGKEIKSDDVPCSRIPFYNYECTFRTKDVQAKVFFRFAKAWKKYFGRDKLGARSESGALKKFMEMQVGRFNARKHKVIRLEEHPKVMQESIRKLKPEQFGRNLWGKVEDFTYAKSS